MGACLEWIAQANKIKNRFIYNAGSDHQRQPAGTEMLCETPAIHAPRRTPDAGMVQVPLCMTIDKAVWRRLCSISAHFSIR
jgi:hypothetical protein